MSKRKGTPQYKEYKEYILHMYTNVKTLEKTLEPIESERAFFDLYDSLSSNQSDFLYNRCQLLAAWKRGGELFTLKIKETQELYENFKLRSDLAFFANPENPRPSCLNLPVFCWRVDSDTCIMLWTAPHARKLGLASDLLQRLDITSVSNVLPESREFWEKIGITAQQE